MDRCALFVDAGYLLADGAMAAHGTRHREAVSWDYAGLLRLLTGLSRERTGLPLLRCYWYEATVEGRHSAEHDALGDLPGLKLRLSRIRPGRREGVDAQVHRDLLTLARNSAICDAVVVSGDEDLAQVVCDAQDLGIRVTLVHIAADGGWGVSRALRQECDDLIEIGASHLRPYVSLASSGPAEISSPGVPVPLSHAASLGGGVPVPLGSGVSAGNGSPAGYGVSGSAGVPQGNGAISGNGAASGNGSSAGNGARSGYGPLPGGSPSGRGFPSANGAPSNGMSAVSPNGVSPAGGGFPANGTRAGGDAASDGSAPPLPSRRANPSPSAYPGYAQESPATSPAPAVSSAQTPPTGTQPVTQPGAHAGAHHSPTGSSPAVSQYGQGDTGSTPSYQLPASYTGPQPAAAQPVGPYTGPHAAPVPLNTSSGGTTTLADAVKAAHKEGHDFGESVAKDAPALWLEAVLARKPRMPSDLEARLLQGSSLPIDFLLHDEVRHALRRGFWDALEHARS
ncbi:NYN domain-containing protein [Planomonospora corallina]|uniref:NYN domain-containing protein n=1 Tax=Planomonospora corallina TaxID=1806052 RepID=A0ABV8I6I4_9ACTN